LRMRDRFEKLTLRRLCMARRTQFRVLNVLKPQLSSESRASS
jgi:hypothetical protein